MSLNPQGVSPDSRVVGVVIDRGIAFDWTGGDGTEEEGRRTKTRVEGLFSGCGFRNRVRDDNPLGFVFPVGGMRSSDPVADWMPLADHV